MDASAIFVGLFSLFLLGQISHSSYGQDQDATPERIGHLVRIPLPIDFGVSEQVTKTIKSIADKAPLAVRPEEFPIVILEFDTTDGQTGRGSQMEACQALARFLSSAELNRIQTVAFIPSVPTDGLDRLEDRKSQLNGHAVLVAISTNQLYLAENTAIGKAGIGEGELDPLVGDVYRSISQKRQRLPARIVEGMLKKDDPVFRVTKQDGTIVYVNEAELNELESSGVTEKTTTIDREDGFAIVSEKQLAEFGLQRSIPRNRSDLAQTLGLPPESLERSLAEGDSWQAFRISFRDYVDVATVNWTNRVLKSSIQRSNNNMLIVELDRCEGDFDACIRLANELADVSSDQFKTVAFVDGYAVGPAAMLALSCDHLIMSPDARLGGRLDDQGDQLSQEQLNDIKPMVVDLARRKQGNWSAMMAMMNPEMTITRYRNRDNGQERILGNEELEQLEDLDQWAPLGPVGGLSGINATNAERIGLARTIAEGLPEVEKFYQLENGTQELRPTKTAQWLEKVAGVLSSPFISVWLLFAGFFFFSTEMSAPGTGLPGFLATLCFVAFFWSQFLDGNADLIEILLFIVGAAFLAMEIFVLPGFGIFGIGGLIMIVVSLVLASQTFIIPLNSRELSQVPYSLMPVIGAGMGILCAIFALQKVIPNSPYFKRLLLDPSRKSGIDGVDPEAVVDWGHLEGLSGTTTTRLFPAGKARIGGKVYDVISRGQMIEKGEAIEVVEAIGNRVVVASLENPDANS
ncbi:MAG: NfeD family protein [Planctomycetota bacterium]